MSGKTYAYYTALIGAVCGYVVVRHVLSPDAVTLRNALIQGFLSASGLRLSRSRLGEDQGHRVNGWITLFGCGVPGNGMLFRAACALIFLGPVNIPQEAMYWIRRK